MGWFSPGKGPLGFGPVSFPSPDTGWKPMLCYIALRSVERFIEMLPEGILAKESATDAGSVQSGRCV